MGLIWFLLIFHGLESVWRDLNGHLAASLVVDWLAASLKEIPDSQGTHIGLRTPPKFGRRKAVVCRRPAVHLLGVRELLHRSAGLRVGGQTGDRAARRMVGAGSG